MVLLTVVVVLQRQLAAGVLRAVRRRAPGAYLPAIYGMVFFYLLLAVGVLLSVSELVSRFHLPPRFSLVAGGLTLIYLIGSSGAVALYEIVRWVSRRVARPEADPSRRRFLNAAGGVLAAAPCAVLGYGSLVQRTDFRVREIDIPLPGLAKDLDGLRLAQISDIHLSAFLSEADLARVVDAANQARPHIVLVTGDLISSLGDPLDACLHQLSRLRSDAGIFGCLGNHERYSGVENYTAEAGARLGVRFLRREPELLRFGAASLNLVGVDYERAADRHRYLRGMERMVVPGALNVMLSHNPDVFPTAVRKGYDLTLSGHTHGGQVSVEILDQSINPARFFTPYVYGLYRIGARAAYVTRGIGTIGMPVRIGAPPEVSILRLKRV